MYPRKRWTIKSRYNYRKQKDSRLRPAKTGSDFYARKPKGPVIYENKGAVPVGRVIQSRGKRVQFELKNVQWITCGPYIAHGGFGRIYVGKIKFKGKSSPQKAVLKIYDQFIVEENKPLAYIFRDMHEVINRIKKSGAPHVKMSYLEQPDGSKIIVMEPFIKS